MKKSFSEKAKDLLEKLLERDPKKRIGYGVKDAEELMEHPFFDSIDWEKLAKREVKPPYIPKTKRVDDLRHIDPLFKEEKVEDTPAMSNLRLSQKEKNHFSEFTYSKDKHITAEVNYNSDDGDLSQIIEDDEDGNGMCSEEF